MNRTLARTFWPGADPIGKRVVVSLGEMLEAEIVGVVGDVHHAALESEPRAKIYYPNAQLSLSGAMDLIVRTTGRPADMVAPLRAEVQALDPNVPVYSIATMEQLVSGSIAEERFNLLLLGLFATVAVILAAIGIYGVLSYAVARRTREIGVRLALGASGREVLRSVAGRGLALATLGLGLGLIAAYGLTRLMSSLLFGVSPTDPATFAAVGVLLLAVAGVACVVPALRAARVDPLVALRYE